MQISFKHYSHSQKARDDLPAFEIDDRIIIKVEPELAVQLGKLILDSDTENTALIALGHQLRKPNASIHRNVKTINEQDSIDSSKSD